MLRHTIKGLVTNVVDCFNPLFVCLNIKVENFFCFHLRCDIQVERLCLVNMTLTYATSFDGPLLVDCMRLFVEPESFIVQIWCSFWCERTFLLFDEEFFEDRVDTSRCVRNVGSRTCRSYGHQITIADTVFCNVCSQLFPTIGCVATTCEVFTRFPFGTFECRVCTFFFR